MHLITLSFDDGFVKTNLKVAELYERHGLSATFNIVADLREAPNQYMIDAPRGAEQFVLWNTLQARGHEIMPHGLVHENYPSLSFAEGQASVLRCLEIFGEYLEGFAPHRTVFNFPYNASTPELRAWLPTVVRAFRDGGDGINPLPHPGLVHLSCVARGPQNCEAHLDAQIARLLALPEGWLVYNTHGLDDEGWGPISTAYLERLLDRLTQMPSVRVVAALGG